MILGCGERCRPGLRAVRSRDLSTTTPPVTEAAAQRRYPGTPFGEPSRRQRLIKVGAWLGGTALVVVLLNLLGVDVIGWLSDLWDQIKAVPTGYIVAGLAFQTGQTLLAGLSYYGILRAAYPGQVEFWPIVDRLRGRGVDEQLPAGEHRHVRDAAHVRRHHPRRDVRRARSPPISCRRSSSRSRAPSSTSTSSSPCRARSTRTSATSPTIPSRRS